MHKAIAVLLVLACATIAWAQDKTDKTDLAKGGSDVAKAKRMAAVGPKDFDVKKLDGKWFNVANSAAIHKMFIEGCTCTTLEFKRLSDTKLHTVAACQIKDGKIAAVNGTLTMVRPNENKSLFHLSFTEKKGDIKGVEVDKSERDKSKQIEKGDKSEDKKSVKDDKEAKGTIEEDKKGKALEDANAIILKIGDKFEHLVMASPNLDSAWILSRDRNFDDKLLNEYKSFLNEHGFSTTKVVKVDQSKCSGDVLGKGKAAVGGDKSDKSDREKAKN